MRGAIYGILRKVFERQMEAQLRLLLKNSNGPHPRVLYAGQASAPDARLTGGRVKLGLLCQSFPESRHRGNILYLVTSGLPKGALSWVRACRSKGIRIVINQNGVAFPAWASQKECARINDRNRLLLESADYVFFQSHFCQSAVEKWVCPVPCASQVLYNPINLTQFTAAAYEPPPDLRLLLMGSHRHPERVLIALEAASLIKRQGLRFRLRIAGPLAWPEAQEEVQTAVARLGLTGEVELSGPYFNQDAPALYRSSDILIHLQDKDASPTVPLEAMACGLQVIAPASGGLPELVPQDGGELIPVELDWNSFCLPSAQAVADAAIRLHRKRPRHASDLRRWLAERFSHENWLNAHRKVFAELLHE